MPLLDNLLDARLWPWVIVHLLASIPIHRAALGDDGITRRGALYCLVLSAGLVVVTYPAALGLRFAPDLPTLLTAARMDPRWAVVSLLCLLAMLVPALRNRHAGPLLSLWTLSCSVLLFSALREYLCMSRVILVPGPSLVLVVLLSVWLGERLGRIHAARGTAAFSVLTLQMQVLVVLLYAGFAGLQLGP
ncbi:MAG: hypothetical protein FJ164_08870 [Gammaproteobacteria bacterium]|nr:hypothetical protein [Gammaproteobacteria bacterium]